MIKKGFTLAEILITLGIIGIVAAMTMPALITKHKEKQTVTALKRSYSLLQQALLRAVADYGDPINWSQSPFELQNSEGEAEIHDFRDLDIILNYMNVAKDCGHEANGCFLHRYKGQFNATERDFENLNYYRKAILNDGTLIAIQGYDGSSAAGEIWVDVNGKKAPNKAGEDMFLFHIENSTISPYGTQLDDSDARCRGGQFYSCTNWVIRYGNMDYKKKK